MIELLKHKQLLKIWEKEMRSASRKLEFEKAKEMKIKVIGLLGKDGGKQKNTSDIEIIIPSDNTPRIQEAHITILHIICELVEKKLFE